MENKIALTDNLGKLFINLSLKEDLCRILDIKDPFSGALGLYRLMMQPKNSNLFSMLTQILILYDNIELPFYSYGYKFNSDVASFVHLTDDVLVLLRYQDKTLISEKINFFAEQAIPLRPFIINRCITKLFDNEYISDLDKKIRVAECFYNYLVDCYIYQSVPDIDDFLEKNTSIFDALTDLDHFKEHNEDIISSATLDIQDALHELFTLQKIAKGGHCDFYTPSLSDFHTATNVSDAYCILKTQISMIMEEQPAFESLTDVLKFRKKKNRDIKLLRNEVSNLESLLIQGEKEYAIQKAIKDVRSANTSLLKNTPVKQTARLATYFSVPISMLEFYKFGSSYSTLIGVVGTTAQFIADCKDSKNNWLYVAR